VLVEERLLAALSSVLGLLAAILAAIGIYGLVASVVARRQREIGIRVALGAVPGQVARMVVGETFWIVSGGLTTGIVLAVGAALAARSLLAGVLFELSPADPLILSSVVLSILLLAALAAYLPARRASQVDPVAAVRYE
jgi:ABC-type antimicrobial peptide transport system permease subunit